jgi:LysR family glycine cleavage system transcriptional activator
MSRGPRLSLDLLRAFRAAATHLSSTRAARDQSVTQSAISHAVRTLEAQLGHPLFHRSQRALRRTYAGEALYRAADEALTLIDLAAGRIAGGGRTLAVTTTVALASLWLVPRLPRFSREHPGLDVRIVATNDRVDLAREHLDLALHFVPHWETAPEAECLVEYLQFPVCAPALARSRKRPLRTFADLARHVRLDFETVLYGRAWYDWEQWAEAENVRPVVPAATMRFSHYDQVIQAAVEGAGVAIGKWPHLARHLREGTLCAPLGPAWSARVGAFHLVPAATGPSADVTTFEEWLRAEVAHDRKSAPAALFARERRAARPQAGTGSPRAAPRARADARR